MCQDDMFHYLYCIVVLSDGDGISVNPHSRHVNSSLKSLGTKHGSDSEMSKPGPQLVTAKHCLNLGCPNSGKDQSTNLQLGETKCTVQIKRSNSSHQRVNGVKKNDVIPGGHTAVTDTKVPQASFDVHATYLPPQKGQPQPQPRARFTAGPGVNVPDTDDYPGPPADFATPPSEFAGEVINLFIFLKKSCYLCFRFSLAKATYPTEFRALPLSFYVSFKFLGHNYQIERAHNIFGING